MKNNSLIITCITLAAWLSPSYAASQPGLIANNKVPLNPVPSLLEQGRFLDALTQAKILRSGLPSLQVVPNTEVADAYYWLGRCHSALADREQAILCFDSALVFVGTDTARASFHNIQAQRALLMLDEKRLLDALAFFANDIKRNQQAIAEAHVLLAAIYLRKGNADSSALASLQSGLRLFDSMNYASASKAKCLQMLGYYEWKVENNFEKALSTSSAAEKIFLELGGPSSNYLAALYVNRGGCLDDMGASQKAIALYLNAEQNFYGQNIKHPNLISVYNNLGRSFSNLGDYTTAIQYLEKAVAIDPDNGRYWNNLGDAYLSQGNYSQAEHGFLQALKHLKEAKPPKPAELARPYHNLGVIYRQRGQLNLALEYELRSLPLRKSDPSARLDIARSYLGTGECYLDLKKYPEALLYLDSALWLQGMALPSGVYAETSVAYVAKAKTMAAMGSFQAALLLTDSALYAAGYPGAARWNAVSAPPEMLAAMGQKAALYVALFEKNASASALRQAVQLYDTAAQAVRYFRNTLLDSESKATLVSQFRDILTNGVDAALALHALQPAGNNFLNLAFAFSEQSKSLVLLEGVRSAGAIKFEGVPDSILAQERQLREAVTEAEVALKKLSDRGLKPGEEKVIVAKDTLFNRQRAFERFQQMLASGQYANYFNARYGVSLATPEEIRAQLLGAQGSMVAYFIGKQNQITAFVITPTVFQAVNCPFGADIDSLVETLRKGIYGYYGLPTYKREDDIFAQTTAQYLSSGQALYTGLIAPLESLLTDEVVIVPDGLLAKIPFELLLAGAPTNTLDFGTYPYWFKRKNLSLSYSYSATLLREMTQKKHRKVPTLPLFAMAPFFPGTRSDVESHKPISSLPTVLTPVPGGRKFKSLPYSGEELLDICALWKGQYYVGKESAKSLFWREASRYQMLHLSTHGVLDSSFSFLAFAPAPGEAAAEALYIRDLYNLTLNADLVTLSACETGIGEFQRGEGVISLARAFAYAGAKSIVTSLWQVDNAATKELMVAFYGNLKAGKPKHIALRDAKLQYLSNPAHTSELSHPFFWAALVGVGDMEAIH